MLKSLFVLTFILIGNFSNAQGYSKDIDFNKLSLQFEDASYELKTEYIPLIYRLADTIRRTPEMHVLIRGHVCCVKKNGLAKKRAKVVREYLMLFGVDKKQLSVIGMKNTMPVVFPEKSKSDQLANMRVDFVLSK